MQTFATPAPVTAVLTVPAGRIHVTAADRADTTVEIRPADPAKSRDAKLAERVTAAYSDGVLRVTAPAANRVLGSSGAVEVTVPCPPGPRSRPRPPAPASPPKGRSARSPSTARRPPSASPRPPPPASPSSTATSPPGTWTATRSCAPSGAASGSPRPPGAPSPCAPRPARSPSARPPGTSATLDAGTTVGRVSNSLKNTGGTPELAIHATTTVGDITASSR